MITVVKGGPSWTDIVIAAGTTVTAATAGGAAFIGLRGARGSREDAAKSRELNERHTRQTRAIHYLERYNERGHIPARNRLYTFFLAHTATDQQQQIEAWNGMTYLEQVRAVEGLNFWEELAGMYNRNLVEREIIDDYFGPEAEFIWNRIFWFVTYQRETHDPDALRELESMLRRIRPSREAKGKQVIDGPVKDFAMKVPTKP
ncbi:MAG TPA: hypothetical protein VK730_04395 [Solirubrobacteraceae bacterium]|nr:hypothetical protein [Solirubrobacteraceae bacterium]